MKYDILKKALAGGNFTNMHIVDCHCHMGNHYNFYFQKADIEEMIEDADRIGLEKICIAPHASIFNDYKLGNRQLSEAINKYPHRVFGLLVLNPGFPEEMDGEFGKYYSIHQFVGVKIHPNFHKCNINDKTYHKVFEFVKKHGGYILTHSWEDSPYCNMDMCEEIIRTYPQIGFILGHAGGTKKGVEKSIRLVNEYENAYLDTCGFDCSMTWIEEIVMKADQSKILFASDYPYLDLEGGISRILFADLDDEVKLDILSKNYWAFLAKYPKKFK